MTKCYCFRHAQRIEALWSSFHLPEVDDSATAESLTRRDAPQV